jgi:hypothetical protein
LDYYFSTLPFMNRARAQREEIESERKARLHFAVFVNTQVGKDLLDGTPTLRIGRLDGLVGGLNRQVSSLASKLLSNSQSFYTIGFLWRQVVVKRDVGSPLYQAPTWQISYN